MDFLSQIITWINVPANALGRFLLSIIAVLPGWLSNTIISAITGVLLLAIFKATSNQAAIAKIRDGIKANMLALKLFKDSLSVTLHAQGQVFKGAFLLLFRSIKPMLVMMVPVIFLLIQLGMWYQFRPLLPTEEAVVTMQLNDNIDLPWPDINIKSMPSIDVITGPIRVVSKKEVYWKIKALENGDNNLIVQLGQQQFEKQLVIGEGFVRISTKRPGWHWADILQHPLEKPFGPDSAVQSISIDYPNRPSYTSGTNYWLIYFFIASMVFALIFKPFLKVRI